MEINRNHPEMIPEPTSTASRRRSRKSQLIQAAALAAVLVPLGSVAVETSSITCNYSGFSGFATSCTGGASGGNPFIFDYGPYSLDLSFRQQLRPFQVTIQNLITTQGALVGSGRLANFPGYQCDPIAGGTNCVDFALSQPIPAQGVDFSGFFDLFIHWNTSTPFDAPGANPATRLRILHNTSAVPGDGFDTDICLLFGCFYDSEPGLGGQDSAFQSFLVAQAPVAAVPEPATLLLVSSGVSGLLYRRRRRRQLAERRDS